MLVGGSPGFRGHLPVRVLAALSGQFRATRHPQRCAAQKNEVLYGDFVTGHGIHPGYAGTGVSIGGSHMCLFLALASKTPARVEDGVLDKMMDRAQELCPTAWGPTDA